MSKLMFKRLRILLIIMVCFFVVLGARLAYLQVYQHEYYMFRAEENRLTKMPIPASRGKVFDQQEKELISNRPGFGIFLVELEEDYDRETLKFLSEQLELDTEEIKRKIHENRYTRYRPVHLKNVDYETMAKIAEHQWKLQGVNIEVQPLRHYPFNEVGAHIMGFLSKAPPSDSSKEQWKNDGYDYRQGDLIGQGGLEKAWESTLRGEDGEQLIETNVLGQAINYLDRREPVPGDNLYLTLDIEMQRIAMESLENQIKKLQNDGNRYAQRGTAVVIDTQTGGILALASYPSYDPNTVKEDYKDLQKDPRHPMVNFALSGTYPIGSSYKMVTGAAALETGSISERTVYNCAGTYSAVGDTRSCLGVHGNLNIYRALAVSCNIFFYRAGLQTGIDNLAYYTREMGLGKQTGLQDITGEVSGVVASREYKEERHGERWYQAETMSAAIGQTFHRFTPLQLAVYTSIIANAGKHYRPFLVEKVETHEGEIIKEVEPEIVNHADFSQRTFRIIQEGMRQATAPERFAGREFRDFPIEIAGKTGTAQVARRGSGIPPHGVFVSYAPYDDPEIAVAVLLEHGESGASGSSPVAREIKDYYFREELGDNSGD